MTFDWNGPDGIMGEDSPATRWLLKTVPHTWQIINTQKKAFKGSLMYYVAYLFEKWFTPYM